MVMKCKKCDHEWTYTGKNPYYVTCPRCYNKVKVETQGAQKQDE